ncbi:MFS transporter [Rickettsiella endosymbiont of Rhagonycha lignosa]|uniref:MFS transporter n=1 Tax=Rickettsiella endosymbiont of Rhagonycha lignosa TaxID=3077937 RepID=UPI00313C8A0E
MQRNNKKITLLFPISLILYELPLYFSNNLFLPALPEVTKNLQVTNAIGQLSIAYWFLGASLFQVFLEPLSDHYGRKNILLGGGVLFVFATLLCGLTHYIIWFLIGRFFQGCVVSSILVTGYAAIREIMEREQAVKTISWMTSIAILAPALGPLLGSLLLQRMNWRELFIALSAFTVLNLYLLYTFMPDSRASSERLKLEKIFFNYRTIFTNFQFWTYTLFFCFLFASLIAWNTLSPFYLMDYLKLNLIQFGFVQLLVYGSFIVGIYLKRLLIYPIEEILKRGLFLTIIYFILSLFTLIHSPSHLFWVVGSVLLFCMSTGLIFNALHRKAIEIPKVPMGTIISVFSITMNLFGFLGSLVARSFNI